MNAYLQSKGFIFHLKIIATAQFFFQWIMVTLVAPPLAKVFVEVGKEIPWILKVFISLGEHWLAIFIFGLINTYVLFRVDIFNRLLPILIEVIIFTIGLGFDLVAIFFPFQILTGGYIPD